MYEWSECDDSGGVWAPADSTSEPNVLEVTYEHVVKPTHVEIYATYAPGGRNFVRNVSVSSREFDVADGQDWVEVWSGNYSVISCPFVLSVPLGGLSNVRRVRIETRTEVDFYEEIDAVALVQVSAVSFAAYFQF